MMDLTTALLTAVSALSAAVIFLYLQSLSQYRECLQREKECNDKHSKLLERVVRVETEREVFDRIEERLAASLVAAAKIGQIERRGPG